MGRQGTWKDERGFTLIEVMLVIILMGIVFGDSHLHVVRGSRVAGWTPRPTGSSRTCGSRIPGRRTGLTDSSFSVPSRTARHTRTDPSETLETRTAGDEAWIPRAENVAFCHNGVQARWNRPAESSRNTTWITVSVSREDPLQPLRSRSTP